MEEPHGTQGTRPVAAGRGLVRALRPNEGRSSSRGGSTTGSCPWRREHGLLGMPVPVVHGGRGADMWPSTGRIGRERRSRHWHPSSRPTEVSRPGFIGLGNDHGEPVIDQVYEAQTQHSCGQGQTEGTDISQKGQQDEAKEAEFRVLGRRRLAPIVGGSWQDINY